MNINETAKENHDFVVSQFGPMGPLPEQLMMVVEELGEAMSAYRKQSNAAPRSMPPLDQIEDNHFKWHYERCIKGTIEEEVTDAAMRLMGISHDMKMDLEWFIKAKMRYNKLRTYWGGKRC